MARPLFAALVVVLAGCQPVVNARFSDIEVTRPNNQVPPAQVAAPTSVTFQVALNSSTFGASTDPNTQDNITKVDLRRLWFTATSGVSDLSFVENLHALAFVPIDKTTSNQNVSARQVEIADYTRVGGAAAASPTFEVPIPEPVNLLPLLRPTQSEPRQVRVEVNLGGKMPTVQWYVDVSMSIAIEFRE